MRHECLHRSEDLLRFLVAERPFNVLGEYPY
jgi:hypothetical protein